MFDGYLFVVNGIVVGSARIDACPHLREQVVDGAGNGVIFSGFEQHMLQEVAGSSGSRTGVLVACSGIEKGVKSGDGEEVIFIDQQFQAVLQGEFFDIQIEGGVGFGAGFIRGGAMGEGGTADGEEKPTSDERAHKHIKKVYSVNGYKSRVKKLLHNA